MARREDLLSWSFIGLLSGGILIAVVGLIGAAMVAWMGISGWMPHTPQGRDGIMPGGALFTTMSVWMGAWGLLAGGLAVAAALGVRSAPQRAVTWGVLGLVAAALSLPAMGGWLVGVLAVLVGSVMALAAGQRHPETLFRDRGERGGAS